MRMCMNSVECSRNIPSCIHKESPVSFRKELLAVCWTVEFVNGLATNYLGHEKAAHRSITTKVQCCCRPCGNFFQGVIPSLQHHTPKLFLLIWREGLLVNLGGKVMANCRDLIHVAFTATTKFVAERHRSARCVEQVG